MSALLYRFILFVGQQPKLGGVDYSWSANALHDSFGYIATMMSYVMVITQAIAALVCVIAAFQIYFKINAGEEGFKKDIMMLLGGIFFILGSAVVFPAFFGFNYGVGGGGFGIWGLI